jgi:hypothetical protein
MRGAGVWADAATGLQGIENWLNDHPELMALMDNTGSLVKVGGKQKKEAPLFGASVLPTAAHVPAARAQEDDDKITNPRKYDPNWDTHAIKKQQAQPNNWQEEISNATEQIQILQGILKEQKP